MLLYPSPNMMQVSQEALQKLCVQVVLLSSSPHPFLIIREANQCTKPAPQLSLSMGVHGVKW